MTIFVGDMELSHLNRNFRIPFSASLSEKDGSVSTYGDEPGYHTLRVPAVPSIDPSAVAPLLPLLPLLAPLAAIAALLAAAFLNNNPVLLQLAVLNTAGRRRKR